MQNYTIWGSYVNAMLQILSHRNNFVIHKVARQVVPTRQTDTSVSIPVVTLKIYIYMDAIKDY